MLSKLILLLLQVAIAWVLTPFIYSKIPVPGDFGLLLYAILFSIIVFLTGVLGALVLKDVGTPSGGTLSAALIVALVVAALITFVPQIVALIPGNAVSQRGLVLAGALIGYWARR